MSMNIFLSIDEKNKKMKLNLSLNISKCFETTDSNPDLNAIFMNILGLKELMNVSLYFKN